MLQFFVCHIDFNGYEQLTPLNALFSDMIDNLIKSLNNIELNDPQNDVTVNDPNDCIYINFPVSIEYENTLEEKFVTKKVVVRATQHSSFQEFLRQIYQQLPKKDRNVQLFVKSLIKSKADIELDEIKLFRQELINSITDHANGETEKQVEAVFFNKANSETQVILPQEKINQHVNNSAQSKQVASKEGIIKENNEDITNEKQQTSSFEPSTMLINKETNQNKTRTLNVEEEKNNDTIVGTSSSGTQSLNISSVNNEQDIERESERKKLNDIENEAKNEIQHKHDLLAYPYPIKRKKNENYILNNTHMLFIYTDIVDFSIYANRLFKLIRIVPFYPLKVNEGVNQLYTAPEYYPLSKNFIDSISIKINNRGEPLRFITEDIPIYIKLHFKKV